jgi:dipeptidyl aminopeptidase/acylaminoacyl peptidase
MRLPLPLLIAVSFVVARADDPKPAQSQEAIQKQIEDLQKQLAELKKGADAKPAAKKTLTLADADIWKYSRGVALSNDGKWFALRVGPLEGDGEIVLRNIDSGKEHRFSGGATGQLQFSFDSKWLAFSAVPSNRPATLLSALMPRTKAKVVLVKLENQEKTELEGMNGFTFAGEAATHIALRKASETPAAPATSAGPPSAFSAAAVAAPSFTGSDLLLRELATGNDLLIGNVSEYGFDRKGQWLVTLVDAAQQIGNGVHLRHLTSGSTTVLESGKAGYKNLAWHENGVAFALLKQVGDKDSEALHVVGWKTLDPKAEKVVFDPKTITDFPKDMVVSANRTPGWTAGLDALSFGIAEKKKDTAKKETTPAPKSGDAKTAETTAKRPTSPADANKPDLVIWHWQDERLQPAQQLTASAEKLRTDLCVYRIAEKKFLRLADDSLRSVILSPKGATAIGSDLKAYQYMSTLNGQRFQDVYGIDLKTGTKAKLLTKARYYMGVNSTGTHILYYDDGHYFVKAILNSEEPVNITKAITETSFVDVEDDHNVRKPPTRPLGFSRDGKHVLLTDNWDLWQVALDGSGGRNLTHNGKADQLRYTSFIQHLDPDEREPGYDFNKPAFIKFTGEWTKKEGYALYEPKSANLLVVHTADAMLGPLFKARNANVYISTRQTALDAPDYHASTDGLKSFTKLSTINPQQKDYNWCAGTKLVDYVGVDKKKLQGALYLPANYEKGKKYPTVVYIYEKLSDRVHSYTPPGSWGLNFSIYTSNGYAVFTPDLTYRINDPGVSAVECMLPALDAAIATGIVDGDKLGLQGHSWGGYQTAFLVTQTNRFKAAIAGAPLTDLISMYSSVYWNTGSANQPIFESSQGRFSGGYWEQEAAYIRNSPVFHATKVKTPLVILHNDKDGAVDFTQGVEYFNTLRRLQKPVVMLQYKGENHGLVIPANRKDYSVRMKEFFDHYLQGKPAPDWWTEGVPHLKMDEHLKKRKG